jgi:peptide/nickel transport system substrate-binding protein
LPASSVPPANTTATTTATTTPGQDVEYNTYAVASYAVGLQPQDWDIHSASAAPWYLTLEQVLAQVWPSAFDVGADGAPMLDTSLLNSATEVSSDPQIVVYQINPRAVWSDGRAITYVDFAYNWQAQSGKTAFSDLAGKTYTPLDESGYDDIASVSGAPSGPYTVTVTFSHPYPDWQSLFSYLMPAHVGRAVGFDSGFTDPVADLVSGGPYLVSELQDGYSLELVRNAQYWGSPANLSTITYYFMSGAAETINALSAGDVDVAQLEAGPATSFKQLQATSGLSVEAVASNFYEDLDFNERDGPLSSPVLREAVMMALDRSGMASEVLGPYGLATTTVDNRVYLRGQPGYAPDGASYDQAAPAAAVKLLEAKGYTLKGNVLRSPAGSPVQLSLFVQQADPVAQELAPLVASSLLAIGVTVTPTPGGPPNADMFDEPSALPPGWQMAIELRQVPLYPSQVARSYATGGATNLDGYSSAAMNALANEIRSVVPAELPALYGEIDDQAWKDFVDIPLVQVPVVLARDSSLLNVEPGPYFGDIAWDEQDWGFRAP